ncbi:response regulator [Brucella sp. HL-2]|nr:response regulator [Brucella sp. HL-2]MCV9909576.1 response regulator [Brucella sp. HL-2]
MTENDLCAEKILIVEDDGLMLHALLTFFKRAFDHCMVLTASTFFAAEKALEENAFSLVVLDPGLPDFGVASEAYETRLSVIEKVQTLSPTARHIIITGRYSIEEAEKCRHRGVKAYVGKFGLSPPTLAEILEQIDRTEFINYRGSVSGMNKSPHYHYPGVSPTDEEVLKWVAARPQGMKRVKSLQLMAKHFNLKTEDSAEKKYKRARNKFNQSKQLLKDDQ